MVGIKLSKTAIFDIIYHTFPESGTVTFVTTEPSDYILGVGTDDLAQAIHAPVNVDLVGGPVTVHLQSRTSDKPTWNKTHSNGQFSDPVTKITEDDCDDVDLYAKWTQSIFKLSSSFSKSGVTKSGIEVSSGDVLFSWK